MTIRRRLFISNILMIVIPLVTSLAVFYAGLWLYTTITGIRDSREFRDGEIFFAARMRLAAMAERWRADIENTDFARMVSDVDSFNDELASERERDGAGQKRSALTVYVCRDGVVIFPKTADGVRGEEILKIAPNEPGGTMVFSGAAAYVVEFGDYRAILTNSGTHVRSDNADYRMIMRWGTIAAIVCSVFIILITNQLLTRFIFRGIVNSIDTLVGGVRQIRDGNLGYRIEYTAGDEFAGVASDLNDMAGRLEASVEARRRDETSRRELIAGISHDLRTPLTSIKAYIEGIQQGVAATPEAREKYITTIMNKADDLEHIIEMLFMFTKLDTDEFPFRMERSAVGSIVEETVDAARDEYAGRSPRVEMTFTDRSAGAQAEIDIVQFRSAMLNVIGNSIKYCDKDTAEIDIRTSVDGDMIKIAVEDNGPGVPASQLDRIFDVFYRSDPARREPSKGSGLGLAITSKIISRLGGEIRAERREPCGLKMTISLPLSK